MAATVGAAADHVPADGTLYFDYLVGFPLGISMAMELQPDAEAMEQDETAEFKFLVTKVGDDRRIGMPRCFGAEVDTGTFFEYVKEMMEGEDSRSRSRTGSRRRR